MNKEILVHRDAASDALSAVLPIRWTPAGRVQVCEVRHQTTRDGYRFPRLVGRIFPAEIFALSHPKGRAELVRTLRELPQ
ncbi:MAG TPA: hypothetical protein VFB13_17710 [Reyranella sp.]|nr:hypothetical protein [Reyranella sp.]